MGCWFGQVQRFCHTLGVEQNDDFWMAIATTLPMLGLTLLLVARTQLRRALESRFAMVLLGCVFAPALLGLPVVEIVALSALAKIPVSDAWMGVALFVFMSTTVALFVAPGLNLLAVILAPLGARATLLMWSGRWLARRMEWENRRSRRELGRIIQIETGRIEMISAAVWRSTRTRAQSESNLRALRRWYLSEASQLEVIAQEFELRMQGADGRRESLVSQNRAMVREMRAASSLSAWGGFSGSIGQEGADEAQVEAAERMRVLRIAIDDLRARRHRVSFEQNVWQNRQTDARWRGIKRREGVERPEAPGRSVK
jgi:hypothetical protein